MSVALRPEGNGVEKRTSRFQQIVAGGRRLNPLAPPAAARWIQGVKHMLILEHVLWGLLLGHCIYTAHILLAVVTVGTYLGKLWFRTHKWVLLWCITALLTYGFPAIF